MLPKCYAALQTMDNNPEIRDRLKVNKSTYHNKRPRERFICFIRGAKWMKINRLNGPSLIHDTTTWLNQSIHSIRRVCCWLGMQKISLESASEQLSAITISRQQVLPSNLDACANVATCYCQGYTIAQAPKSVQGELVSAASSNVTWNLVLSASQDVKDELT